MVVSLSCGAFILYLLYMYFERPVVLNDSIHLKDGRQALWHVELDMIRQSPWLGVGSQSEFTSLSRIQFQKSSPGITPEFPMGIPEAHSAYLGWSAYFGIPSLLFWLGWLGSVIMQSWKNGIKFQDRENVWIGMSILLIFLLACIGDMLPGETNIAPFVYLLIGSSFALRRHGLADLPPPLVEAEKNIQ